MAKLDEGRGMGEGPGISDGLKADPWPNVPDNDDETDKDQAAVAENQPAQAQLVAPENNSLEEQEQQSTTELVIEDPEHFGEGSRNFGEGSWQENDRPTEDPVKPEPTDDQPVFVNPIARKPSRTRPRFKIPKLPNRTSYRTQQDIKMVALALLGSSALAGSIWGVHELWFKTEDVQVTMDTFEWNSAVPIEEYSVVQRYNRSWVPFGAYDVYEDSETNYEYDYMTEEWVFVTEDVYDYKIDLWIRDRNEPWLRAGAQEGPDYVAPYVPSFPREGNENNPRIGDRRQGSSVHLEYIVVIKNKEGVTHNVPVRLVTYNAAQEEGAKLVGKINRAGMYRGVEVIPKGESLPKETSMAPLASTYGRQVEKNGRGLGF